MLVRVRLCLMVRLGIWMLWLVSYVVRLALPMTYLGMPLWAHYKDSLIWNPIIERMEKKLSDWKNLY